MFEILGRPTLSWYIMAKATALERRPECQTKNLTQRYIDDLEVALQGAKAQMAQMEAAYYKQGPLVKPEQAKEHEKIFADAQKAHNKATEATKDLIYSWRPQQGLAPPQAMTAPRIVDDLKPKEVLSSSANIERFRHWKRQYKAFMTRKRPHSKSKTSGS